MRRIRTQITALILSISAASPLLARATSFVERPFPETVQEAPVIVRGTIGASTTDWGKEGDGGRRIFTYWDLRVGEVHKGLAGSHTGDILKIREMGGEKDGMGMQVSGTASFLAGEEVVVFLSDKNAESSYDVWGLMMGKLNVKLDADGHENLSGPAINGEHGDYPHTHAWTIESLRKLIAAQAKGQPSAVPATLVTPTVPTSTQAPPAPSPSPSALPAPIEAAPQLQISAPGDQGLPTSLWIVLGALVLGIAGFVIAKRR